MFRNILVATDGSPMARRAIRLAVRLAREQKARVTGFYAGPAWQPDMYAYGKDAPPGFITPGQHADQVRRTADRHLAVVRKAAAAAGVPCQCSYVEGVFPYVEIIKAAKRNRCDLIVMASHGRKGLAGLVLGSETTRVLTHSKVPVLVCR